MKSILFLLSLVLSFAFAGPQDGLIKNHLEERIQQLEIQGVEYDVYEISEEEATEMAGGVLQVKKASGETLDLQSDYVIGAGVGALTYYIAVPVIQTGIYAPMLVAGATGGPVYALLSALGVGAVAANAGASVVAAAGVVLYIPVILAATGTAAYFLTNAALKTAGVRDDINEGLAEQEWFRKVAGFIHYQFTGEIIDYKTGKIID